MIDRAAMILGDAGALVKDLVCSLVVHPASLPLSFRLSNPNASAEIMHDAAQVLNQAGLFGADSRNNEVVADVMLRPLRDGRKRMPVDTDLSPQPTKPMNAGHRSVKVARGVIETAADSAGELVEIDVLAAPTTGRAPEPRPRLLVPQHGHPGPVHQNIRHVPSEPVTPTLAAESPRRNSTAPGVGGGGTVRKMLHGATRRRLAGIGEFPPIAAQLTDKGTFSGQ